MGFIGWDGHLILCARLRVRVDLWIVFAWGLTDVTGFEFEDVRGFLGGGCVLWVSFWGGRGSGDVVVSDLGEFFSGIWVR